ncbi:MAG: hypothetical protein ACJ76F_07305 [Bacteroidia bacterium]
MDKELMDLEWKIAKSSNDTAKTFFALRKMDLYLQQEDFSAEAIAETKRVDEALIRDTLIRSNFLWNAALLSHLAGETGLSRHYINEYRIREKDSTIAALLLELMIYSDFDTSLVTQRVEELKRLNDSLSCLSCINKVMAYKRQHRKAYLAASAVVPGSGSIANGNVGKGATSLALNGGVVYAVYALMKNNLYFNAISWGLALGVKFYTGNLRLTSKLFYEKEEKKKNKLAAACELNYKRVLDQYPLQFR